MATITVPPEVGIHAVGVRVVQPLIVHRSAYTGAHTSLLPGETYLAGTCEVVDLSTHPDLPASATGIPQVLRFFMLLEGSGNQFELKIPERIMPWAQPDGAASVAATGVSGATLTLPALPSGLEPGNFVRVGDRVHCITGINAGALSLTIKPEIEYGVGVAVKWGVRSVLAVMDGDPSDFVLRSSRRRHPSRVTVPWYEVV